MGFLPAGHATTPHWRAPSSHRTPTPPRSPQKHTWTRGLTLRNFQDHSRQNERAVQELKDLSSECLLRQGWPLCCCCAARRRAGPHAAAVLPCSGAAAGLALVLRCGVGFGPRQRLYWQLKPQLWEDVVAAMLAFSLLHHPPFCRACGCASARFTFHMPPTSTHSPPSHHRPSTAAGKYDKAVVEEENIPLDRRVVAKAGECPGCSTCRPLSTGCLR